MILSHIDELLINEVAKALLLLGVYSICRNRRENSKASIGRDDDTNLCNNDFPFSTSTSGNDNNNDWTTYFQRSIPHRISSPIHTQLINEIRLRRLSHLTSIDLPCVFSGHLTDIDILQMAYSKVEHPWTTFYDEYTRCFDIFYSAVTVNHKSAPMHTSISLFHCASSSTTMLNSFMTLDIIRERTENNISAMVSMFKDVTYLEDLIPDLDEICSLLRNELVVQILDDTTNAIVDDTKGCDSLGQDIIDLNRHWFDRTRKGVLQSSTSHDNRMIQTEMAYSLTQVIKMVDSQQQQVSASSDRGSSFIVNFELYESCIRTLLDMFADWMDRNIYRHSDPKMKEIGITLWQWSICHGTRLSNNVRKQQLIYHYCPTGIWMCQYWTQRYMTKTEMMELLSQSPTPSIQSTNTLLELYNNASNCLQSMKSITISERNDDFGTCIWILSLFRSILLSTRVYHFPWHLLVPVTASPSVEAQNLPIPTDQLIQQMFRCYHQLLTLLIDDSQRDVGVTSLYIETVGSICIDVIEVLISGTKRQELLNVHIHIIQKMRSTVCVDAIDDRNGNETGNANRLRKMIQKMINRLSLCGLVMK